jgi:hypothetical protein
MEINKQNDYSTILDYLSQLSFTWTVIFYTLSYILSNILSYTVIVKYNSKGHNNAGQNQM